MKKFLFALFSFLIGFFVILFGTILLLSKKELPPGAMGRGAEALADRIEKATNLDGWEKTAALSFQFGPTGTTHFLDFKRGLSEARWKESEQEILVQWMNRNWNHRVS